MPNRHFSSGSYRYGFNGKENDNEIKGVQGSQQDYGFRIYDPRLGKFLSSDPLTKAYPELTPYQFASNSPIANIDVDGLEAIDIKLRQHDLSYTKKTEAKWIEGYSQFGAAGALGAAIFCDIYVTRGKLSQFLFTYVPAASLFEHNPVTTAEGKIAQQERHDENLQALTLNVGIYVVARGVTEVGGIIFKQIRSTSIRFSQNSVNDYQKAVDAVNSGTADPIDIVKMNDGLYTTVDNTRLLAAQNEGKTLSSNFHNYDDLLPESMATRFENKATGEYAKTWGEAVETRVANQTGTFSTDYKGTGTFVKPKVNSQ